MKPNVKKLNRQIQALPLKLKDALAARLMLSVDEPSKKEVEQLWYEEAEDRLKACLEGKMKLIPWEKILRESRKLLRSKR